MPIVNLIWMKSRRLSSQESGSDIDALAGTDRALAPLAQVERGKPLVSTFWRPDSSDKKEAHVVRRFSFDESLVRRP
jgi:hypothetical protein